MREQSLFIEALEINDPAERAAFLDRACAGDPALRERIERLLQRHEQSGSFMEQPPAVLEGTGLFTPAPEGSTETPGEGPNTVIGPYKLVEEIGEGGMGTVYLAQQMEPVKRLVALKVIKPGMDSRQVIARFEAERQALALMDHPNIARVFDAGTTTSGRPYFVMELVKGIPITHYCDEARLTPRQRLELFIPVCQAVQHAHQKGIIHRDLKPSNILVCLYDGKPVPKVIDFGIAKAAGQQLTDKTLITGFGSVVGTLEYMSPEQAELNQLDIDTRSDIYSLGVVLYELLTGTTPLEKKRLKQAAMLEVLRVIREEEPPRPSTRLSTTEELPQIAANRGLEPRQLSGLVRGELDWVVMKALDKDRSRRYETANDFALDIQRYLANEPVLAGPPSRTYRLRKFLRRNRGPVLAGVLVLLALIGGIIGTTVGLVWEKQARATAEDATRKADTAREAAVTAEQKERGERQAKETALAGEHFQKERWRRAAYFNHLALARNEYQANHLVHAEEMIDDEEKCPKDLRGFEWHYLKRLCHSELRRFRAARKNKSGPSGALFRSYGQYSYCFSPDGSRLAVVHAPALDLFDTSTGNRIASFDCGRFRVDELAFSADGKLLATASIQQTGDVLNLWDAVTGANLARLPGPRKRIPTGYGFVGAAFSPDGRRVAATDARGNLLVWDLDSLRQRLSAGPAGFLGQQIGAQAVAPSGTPLGAVPLVLGSLAGAGGDPFAPQPMQNVYRAGWTLLPMADRLATTQLLCQLLGQGFGAASGVPAGAVGPLLLGLAPLAGSAAGPYWPRYQIAAHPQPGEPPNARWITKLAFSPDSKLIATASEGDATVRLWDARTGKLVRDLGRGADFTRLAFSPKGTWLAAAGAYESGPVGDVSVWVWHVKEGKTYRVLRRHNEPITCLAFSPDEKQLAAGSRNGTMTVWDVAMAREIGTYRGHEGEVLTAAFSADGRRVLTLDIDDVVRTWDATRPPEWRSLPCRSAWQASFSGDGRRVAAAAHHATGPWATVVWDAATGRELASFGVNFEYAQAVALSPDGRRVAAAVTVGNNHGMVQVWDLSLGQLVHRRSQAHLLGQYVGAEAVGLAAAPVGGPMGCLLLRLGAREGLKWDKYKFGLVRNLPEQGLAAPCDAVAWSADGRWIASGGQDRVVRLWDAATGKQVWARGGHARTISGLAFSRDGKRLASGSGGITRQWPGNAPNPPRTPVDTLPLGRKQRAGNEPNPLRLTSDTAEAVPDVKVWEVATGKELRTFNFPGKDRMNPHGAEPIGHPGKGPGLALSPDGEILAVTLGQTGMQIVPMGNRGRWVQVYAASHPDVVRLYRVTTGAEVAVLKGHTQPAWCVAFSPDGRRVVTGSSDQTIKLWDARTGAEMMTIGSHPDAVTGVAFSPDGQKIVSTCNGGPARIWDAAPAGGPGFTGRE